MRDVNEKIEKLQLEKDALEHELKMMSSNNENVPPVGTSVSGMPTKTSNQKCAQPRKSYLCTSEVEFSPILQITRALLDNCSTNQLWLSTQLFRNSRRLTICQEWVQSLRRRLATSSMNPEFFAISSIRSSFYSKESICPIGRTRPSIN